MPNKLIVVSDELKAEMDQFNEDVNWSQVARDAFEERVRVCKLKGAGKMEAAGIERLKASRNSLVQREVATGEQYGRTWALEHADYEDLDRVRSIDSGQADDVEGAHMLLLDAIFNGDGMNSGEDGVYWMSKYLGTDSPSITRILSFIDGASAVFDEIDD